LSFVKNTRKKASEFLLKKEFQNLKRNVRSTSLSNANTVALLFDASSKSEFDFVRNYIKKLKDEGKKIQALGFYNQKETPVMMNSKLEYDFFTLKDINWHYKPTSKAVSIYMDEPFDILINLCTKTVLPLLHVAAISKAKFKVGMHRDKHIKYYDLLVHHRNENDMNGFIHNIENYLQNIR
jgi:hypothetical protein